ncbi:MAG: hypothetical protein FWF05_05165 [Oscillospiraceae bacterium]|nr:hypothetical protein [Oscillospiraceae bacterium]
MKRNLLLNRTLVEQIMRDAKTHRIVICGASALAGDFQKKLGMLNIDTAFFLSDFDDEEANVRHYSCISGIDNIENYSFVFCFDYDDIHRLYQPIVIALNKAFGEKQIKPKLIKGNFYKTLNNLAGESCYDLYMHRMFLNWYDGKPYVQYGDDSVDGACKIHVYGASTATGNFRYTERCFPDILQEKLMEKGVPSVVYNWSQSNHNVGDYLIQILRNGYVMKPDVVICCIPSSIFDIARLGEQNVLSVVAEGIFTKAQIRTLEKKYSGVKNKGINHKVENADVFVAQQKVFRSLCEFFGFKGLFIISPSPELMPDEIASQIPGITSRHTARMRRLKNAALDLCNREIVKDHSGIFNGASNVHDYYLEWRHFTDLGNDIIADNMADEVVAIL